MTIQQSILHWLQIWWDSPEAYLSTIIAGLIIAALIAGVRWAQAEKEVVRLQGKLDRMSHKGRKLAEERKAKVERPWFERKDQR